MTAPVPEHGSRARYNSRQHACRCGLCCAANTAYLRLYRAGVTGHYSSWRQGGSDERA